MAKFKLKSPQGIAVVVSVLLIFSFGLLLSQSKVMSQQAFDDPDLGVVEVKVVQKGLLQRIFGLPQAVYFSKDTAYVGDRITLSDRGLIWDVEKNFPSIWQPGDQVRIELSVDGSYYKGYYVNVPNTITSSTEIEMRFTVDKVGFWEATATQVRNGALTSLKEYSWGGVTVTQEPPTSCTKQSTWGSWNVIENIEGGTRQKRIWQTVDGDCNYVDSGTVERKTVCSSGYDISGSSTSQVASGYQLCEPVQIDTGCSADVTSGCPDGSSIVVEACTNGELIPTGNTCPTITYIGVFRFENNACFPVEIEEGDRLPNDYDTVVECSANIVTDGQDPGDGTDPTATITIYRYANSRCTQLTITETSRTSNDYDSISACAANIADSVTVYRSVGGACVETVISQAQQGSTDFTTQALCLASLSSLGGFNLDDLGLGNTQLFLIGGGILAGVVVVMLMRRR